MEQKITNYQTTEYKYDNVAQMMTHIADMGLGGWVLVWSSHVTLKAIYQKDLPL